jgi:hypothetical protein
LEEHERNEMSGDSYETQKHMTHGEGYMAKGKGMLSTMPKMVYRKALVKVGNTSPDMTRGTKAQSSINMSRGPGKAKLKY